MAAERDPVAIRAQLFHDGGGVSAAVPGDGDSDGAGRYAVGSYGRAAMAHGDSCVCGRGRAGSGGLREFDSGSGGVHRLGAGMRGVDGGAFLGDGDVTDGGSFGSCGDRSD